MGICDNCGLCCQKSIIEIEHLDVVREPRLLPVVRLLDGNGKIKYHDDWEKVYQLAMFQPCPMLSPENRCTIYPTRPNCCVAFAPGCDRCNELREEHGLPPIVLETTEKRGTHDRTTD